MNFLGKASKTQCIQFTSFSVLIYVVAIVTLFLTNILNCTFNNSYLKHFKYDKNMMESKEKCSLVAKSPARDILLVVSICFRLTPDLYVACELPFGASVFNRDINIRYYVISFKLK